MSHNKLVDIEELLDHYEVNIVKDNNPEYIHCQCPFHDGTGKTPLNFGIHRETGQWRCFAGCGSGDILDFISKSEQCSRDEAQDVLEADFKAKTVTFDKLKQLLNKTEARASKELQAKTWPCWLKPIAPDHPYITYRGLDHESFEHHSASIDADDLTVIYFPIYFDGKLLGFSKRVISQGSVMSWIHDKGLDRKEILYNFDNVKNMQYVIITEGIFDVINLYRLGYTSAVATLGTGFSTTQVAHIIRNWDTVIIAFDGDTAGYEAADKLEKRLVRYVSNLYVVRLPQGVDPGAVKTKEQMQEYMTNNIRRCGWASQNKSWSEIASAWK